MLQHVNDSKYGDVVKMMPVQHASQPLPIPPPRKRVFMDRPTTNMPTLNGIQYGHYHQVTRPVITPISVDDNMCSTLTDAPTYSESTVNNAIDFVTPCTQ